MFKASISPKGNPALVYVEHGSTESDATEKAHRFAAKSGWKPKREVTANQEDVSGAISSRTETDELTGEERTYYTLPAEYTVEVVDLTQDPAWVEEQFRQEREREYAKEGVTEKAMIVALWEKLVEGRPEAADALQAKRANVKARVPKK